MGSVWRCKPFTSGCLLWDAFFLGRFEQLIIFRGTKNIIIILDWRCLSKGSDETDLCLHCSVRESQFLFFNCLLMPKSVVALLGCWLGGFGGHHNIATLGAILHDVMQYLWRERNGMAFSGL